MHMKLCNNHGDSQGARDLEVAGQSVIKILLLFQSNDKCYVIQRMHHCTLQECHVHVHCHGNLRMRWLHKLDVN